MKLDRRIENESLIYTPVTTSKPKLHEKGYFADDMLAFANLAKCDYGELSGYDIKLKYPYRCKHDDSILALAYCYHSFSFLKVDLNQSKRSRRMSEEHLTDEEYLKDLYDNLHDVIECCMGSKEKIQDLDNWQIVHDLEFQLKLAAEKLRRYLAKIGIEE